jgi:hypothetical protein
VPIDITTLVHPIVPPAIPPALDALDHLHPLALHVTSYPSEHSQAPLVSAPTATTPPHQHYNFAQYAHIPVSPAPQQPQTASHATPPSSEHSVDQPVYVITAISKIAASYASPAKALALPATTPIVVSLALLHKAPPSTQPDCVSVYLANILLVQSVAPATISVSPA